MEGGPPFFSTMLWSAIALPTVGFGLIVIIGILVTPIKVSGSTRRVLVAMAFVLIVIGLPGLVLLVGL